MRFLAALGLFFFLAAGSRALAQVAVGAQMERSQFLLYERVDLLVTLTNASETDLALDNDGNHPWLSFMVYNHDHLPVRPERQALFKPLTLKQGETKTLRINLTPLFSFRTEGSYTAQAVVNLPGSGDLVSQEVPFSVQRGREVWTVTRPIDGSNRIYSLLRFSPKPNETDLYLRVEDPSENVVFANVGLGPVEAYIDPQVFFDPAGNIHVLQLIAMSTYLYTRADAQGKVMHQGVFKTFQEIRPRLAQMDDGNVYVQGGLEETPQSAHETLSSGQRGTLTSDQRPQAPATGDFSAAPPDATSPVALPGQTPTPGARPQVDSR
jgi:hypothetical protein